MPLVQNWFELVPEGLRVNLNAYGCSMKLREGEERRGGGDDHAVAIAVRCMLFFTPIRFVKAGE